MAASQHSEAGSAGNPTSERIRSDSDMASNAVARARAVIALLVDDIEAEDGLAWRPSILTALFEDVDRNLEEAEAVLAPWRDGIQALPMQAS